MAPVRRYAVASPVRRYTTRLRNKRKIRNKQLGLYLKRDGLLSGKIRSEDGEIRNGASSQAFDARRHFPVPLFSERILFNEKCSPMSILLSFFYPSNDAYIFFNYCV